MEAVSSPRMATRANRASSARVFRSSSSDVLRILAARTVVTIEVVRKANNAIKSSCSSTRKEKYRRTEEVTQTSCGDDREYDRAQVAAKCGNHNNAGQQRKSCRRKINSYQQAGIGARD